MVPLVMVVMILKCCPSLSDFANITAKNVDYYHILHENLKQLLKNSALENRGYI